MADFSNHAFSFSFFLFSLVNSLANKKNISIRRQPNARSKSDATTALLEEGLSLHFTLIFSVAFNTCVVGTRRVVRVRFGCRLSLLSSKASKEKSMSNLVRETLPMGTPTMYVCHFLECVVKIV